MEYEPLHKMFNHNSQATIDLLPADNEEPLQKSYAGAFNALCDDLAAYRDQREAAECHDRARRQQAQQQQADRQRAEAERNRRLSAKRATRLAKSMQQFIAETPAKIAKFAKSLTAPVPSDSSKLDAALADLTAFHSKVEARRQQDEVRDRFRDLYSLAKAGQLPAMDVCRLDALRIRAIEQGVQL